MSYSLGVDLGATFIAAAIARESGVEMVTLAPQTAVAPALVFLRENGTLVVGDSALQRAATRADRVGSLLKDRVGNPTPVVLGSKSFAVTELLAAQLRGVLRQVVAVEGEQPDQIVLTHPATWEASRRGVFEEVANIADVSNALMIPEPVAAATYYTAAGAHDEQTVAVYDLGGRSFEAAVLSCGSSGIQILGRPEGIEGLGGLTFDDSIFQSAVSRTGGALDNPDPDHLQMGFAISRLWRDCVQAKEWLTSNNEATIQVYIPNRHAEITLTRAEFENMIRPGIELTIEALRRTILSANIDPADVTGLVLTGGSSRIPLVAKSVTQELGCPTVRDTDPAHNVALGAAAYAASAARMDNTDTKPTNTTRQSIQGAPNSRAVASESAPPSGSFSGTTYQMDSDTPSSAHVEATTTSDGDSVHPADSVHPGSTTTRSAPSNGSPSRQASNGHSAARVGLLSRATPPWKPDASAPGTRSPTAGNARSRKQHGWLAAGLAVALLAALTMLALRPNASTIPQAPSATSPAAAVSGAKAAAPPQQRPAASTPTPTVVATVAVASGPQSGAISPDGKLAYITSTETHSITLLDLASNTTVGNIPIPQGPPQFIAFTPDGQHAYVSVYDEIRGSGNAVIEVDTATRTVVATIPAEKFPYAIAVSPDGRQLYVPNHDANLISVVDTASNAVIQKIAVKPNPHAVAYSGDGRRAYVANHGSNLVTVLDTKNGAILAEIPVGRSPHSIAMSPDRSRVYVVNYDGDSVSVIDPAPNTVLTAIPVQREPQSIAFAPDSKHAYVVNDGSNNVSVIDTSTNQVTSTLPTGQDPTSIFVSTDGRHAYITNISSNNITVLDTS